jgi:RNA polymerase sigma factor (sigma-70 family)
MPIDWHAAFLRIKAALVRRGRTEHEADDLLQEAWVRLAQHQANHAIDKPEAFLMRTALNLSIDWHRRTRSRGEDVLVDDVVLLDVTPSAETTFLARERVARLSICIGRLSDKTREIFLAHRLEGLSYQEIARQRHLSVSTVEKHVAKAMLQLTTWMEGW